MGKIIVKVKKLCSSSQIPTKANQADAGWDLYNYETQSILPGETKLLSTGIAMEIPEGWYGQLKTRSGWGSKGLIVTAGVVDSTYRGEIMVAVINTREDGMVWVDEGDRIAQMVLIKVPIVEFLVVDELSPSGRGASGFGSTGR